MHTGRSYTLPEFLVWTRRNIFGLMLVATIPVIIYELAGIKWLTVPWAVVALMGTATAFIVGFKNTQTYNRTGEAQQVWMSVASLSRIWGIMSRDYVNDQAKSKELVNRHFAWLTILRYQLREPRSWETTDNRYNSEYQRFYSIPERTVPLETELAKYLSAKEMRYILSTKNPAAQVLSLQSKTLKELYENKLMVINYFIEMEKGIKDAMDLQGRCERIKNFPYPRQYAIMSTFLVRFFCLLLPLGLLKEFDKLNEMVGGCMKGHMVWWVIPFSVMICWMYTSLEQVGESTANPFEGSANDVPISHLARNIEIDLLEMTGETNLPQPFLSRNNITL